MTGRHSTYRTLLIGTAAVFFLALFLITIRGTASPRSGFNFRWSPSVGLIEIEGQIDGVEGIVRLIDDYASRGDIKGLLVKINSPGGTIVGSDEIYRALLRARHEHDKPVVAYMGTIAASGGYYVACAADTIIAHPGSLTGSIGVILQYPVFTEIMDKVGVRWETVTSGPYKDMGNPFEEPTESHLAWFEEVINDSYDQFFEVVRTSRGLEDEILEVYADGRVFTGRQAVEWGFADRTGDLHDARALVGTMAGLGEDPDLIRPSRPRRLTMWDLIMGRAGIDEIKTELGLGSLDGPRVLYLMR